MIRQLGMAVASQPPLAMNSFRHCALVGLLVFSLTGYASPARCQSPQGAPGAPTRPQEPAPEAAGHTASVPQDQAEQLFRQATDLFAANKFSDAVPVLQLAEKIAPREPVIHHYLGYALWKANRFQEAQVELEQARRLDPKNAYTLYFLGRVLDSQVQTAAAIHAYESEFALGPPVYDTYQRLGENYLRRGDAKKALEMIQKAIQITPWESSLHYQLARIYQKTGRVQEAKEEFDATDRLKQSDQVSIQKLLGMSLAIQQGKADQVFVLRDQLFAQTPRDPEIMHSLGLVLAQGGFYAEAVDPFGVAAQMMPQSFEATYNSGLTLMKLGRTDEAEAALKKAVALRPHDFGSNSALAVLYAGQRRNAEAIERLKAARQTRPDDTRILALLGDQYLQAHNARAAIPLLQDVIRSKPDNPGPYHVLVQAHQEEKDFAEALSVARHGAERFPEDGRFQFEIGNQLSNLGRYAEALPYAQKSIQLNATLVEGHDLVGDIELRQGEYDAALASFERAKALDPGDLEALRGIGQTLVRLKRFDDAVAALNDAIPLHPTEPEFYYDLSQAYVRLGDREKAAQASAKFKELHAIEVARQSAEDQRRALEQKGAPAKP